MVTLPEPSLNGHGGPPLPPPVTFAPPNSPSPSRARWSLRRDSTSTHRGSWSPDTRRSSSASRGSRDRLWRPHSTLVRGPGSQVDPTAEKAQRHRPVQQPFLHKLPRLVSHFFGYRRAKEERLSLIPLLNRLQPRVEEALITFIAVFGSMLLVAAVTMAFSLEYRTVPLAIAALGATAVLVYAVPASPLSQPRNVTGGHLIACVVGLVLAYVFNCSPRFATQTEQPNATVHDFQHLVPVAESLSVAITVSLMQLTGTIHPPGGATALLAATRPTGFFLPTVMCAVVGMQIWALFINNVGRGRWPAYWVAPGDNDENVDGSNEEDDDGRGEHSDGRNGSGQPGEKEAVDGQPSKVGEESTLAGYEWVRRGRGIARHGIETLRPAVPTPPRQHPSASVSSGETPQRLPSTSRTRTLGSVGEGQEEASS